MIAGYRAPGHPTAAPAAIVLLGLVTALTVGCVTRGSGFPSDKIPRIHEYETSQEEILGWFGNPEQERREASGIVMYRYIHEEETTRDTGVLSRIGVFIGRFFGYGVSGAPLNIRYRNETRYDLTVFFDPDGIVTSYVYDRTVIPSKQIY